MTELNFSVKGSNPGVCETRAQFATLATSKFATFDDELTMFSLSSGDYDFELQSKVTPAAESSRSRYVSRS